MFKINFYFKDHSDPIFVISEQLNGNVLFFSKKLNCKLTREMYILKESKFKDISNKLFLYGYDFVNSNFNKFYSGKIKGYQYGNTCIYNVNLEKNGRNDKKLIFFDNKIRTIKNYRNNKEDCITFDFLYGKLWHTDISTKDIIINELHKNMYITKYLNNKQIFMKLDKNYKIFGFCIIFNVYYDVKKIIKTWDSRNIEAHGNIIKVWFTNKYFATCMFKDKEVCLKCKYY
jgi:hypothetical protein